jgi:DNA-binding MarR family transcriptional regulator
MSKPPRLIFLLNSAQRRLQQFIAAEQERAARAGEGAPSPAQSGVLFVLAREDGATMGRLAQALDLAPSAMSGLVQRMEAQHWVARRASELDARTQHVWLQPAGRALLPALHKALGRINESLAGSFSPSELQTVGRWLEHVQTLGDSDE